MVEKEGGLDAEGWGAGEESAVTPATRAFILGGLPGLSTGERHFAGSDFGAKGGRLGRFGAGEGGFGEEGGAAVALGLEEFDEAAGSAEVAGTYQD